jgi:hypothetical protein
MIASILINLNAMAAAEEQEKKDDTSQPEKKQKLAGLEDMKADFLDWQEERDEFKREFNAELVPFSSTPLDFATVSLMMGK